ncbi:hypothetical protein GOODEAATRI_013951, partial [Goodea atripinnis]
MFLNYSPILEGLFSLKNIVFVFDRRERLSLGRDLAKAATGPRSFCLMLSFYLHGSSLFVAVHQAAQVIDVHHGGPGGHGLWLHPAVLGLIQVRHNATQLLACFSLPVALHQVS